MRRWLITFGAAIFLGILQGLTEFIPVSSSGHLVILEKLLGQKHPDLFFDTMLHAGTLIAVIAVFRSDLVNLTQSFFALIRQIVSKNPLKKSINFDPQQKLIGLILISTIPTAIIGFFFQDWFERLFSSLLAVGISLLITGTLLGLTRRFTLPSRDIQDMSILHALIIGIAQGIAITPGISRSGATIATALFLGINRELAGRFSFLIFIPAILGALILNFHFPELGTKSYLYFVLAGTLAASMTGYLALKALLRFVNQGKLYIFAPYLYAIGLFAIVYGIISGR